jgi:hypothetical protein
MEEGNMLKLLSLVIILNFGDYEGCYGTISKIEPITELKTDMTVIKDVTCPNGQKYDYIVGIPTRYLSPSN